MTSASTVTITDRTPPWLEWVAQQGEMGARVAAFDWASTGLGPLTAWPPAVRAALMLCLGSLFPVSLRLGPELLVIYNDACRESFGRQFTNALGRPHREVWPESNAQLGPILESVLTTGVPYFATDLRVTLDRAVPAEECEFTFSYTAIFDESGPIRGVMVTFVETTPRVLAERRLHTLASLARELSPSASLQQLADAALTALADNPDDHPAAALYRVDDGSETLLAGFGEPIDPDLAHRLVRECLSLRTSRHSPTDRLHAYLVDPDWDEAPQVLLIAHHASRPWDEELANYLELIAATLGRVSASQAELSSERGQVARMQALDVAKSAFFASVSHELRTPLTLIAAPVEEALAERAGLSDRARADLELVRGNVDRITRLIDAMLDFSRMEAGRVAPQLRSVEVSDLVHSLAVDFEPAMRRAGLKFTISTPKLSGPALVDHDVLERVVLNLLSNAAKFTPSGSVDLTLSEHGDSYQIAVTDTGVGIAPADQARIFERFERVEAPPEAPTPAGAGIGLAMVQQLVELMGGTVTLRSKPGVGSTFTVTFPFHPVPRPGIEGTSITPRRVDSFLAELESWSRPATRAVGTAQPRLVVVEDDAQLARYLADALAESYRVTIAHDGAEALEVLRAERADLVLSDLSMPGMDGLSLVAAIRADPQLRELPVVLLSARADQDSAVAGFGEGADDYIAKPFSMVDLRARLAANLHRAKERSLDSAWRRAVLSAIHDGVVVFDSDGLVLEINQSFTDLLGFDLNGGPIRPPYPWWPTAAEDADGLAQITQAHDQAKRGSDPSGEYRFYTRDRRPVCVQSVGAQIRHTETGMTASVRVLRDITREKAARERRAAAAQVSADFGTIDDLGTLLGVAEHGFSLLFDGATTLELNLDDKRRLLIADGQEVAEDALPTPVRTGLAGAPSTDTTSLRPGILLVPAGSGAACRAWIQFPAPRRIGPDEMIVADLLAQGFALAVDRVVGAQRAASREANLNLAVESHRMIGQAIGILVERHRIPPNAAFERLKAASQHRNLKLREVARRVIESGQEPNEA